MLNRFLFASVLVLNSSLLVVAQDDKWVKMEADADTLFSKEEFTQAATLYTNLITHSGLHEKKDFQAVYRRALCYYSLHQPEEALKDLDRFITELPEMSRARILRAFVYKDLGKRKQQIEDLSFAIRAQEPRPDLLKWRAEAYIDSGDYSLAKNDLIAAKRMTDDDELELNLGIVYYNTGSMDSAIYSLNNGIEMNPTSVPIYLYATSFCMQEEVYSLALKYVDVALMIQSQNPTALLYKGITLVELDRKDEGCRFLTRAFQAGEDDAGDYLQEYCYGSND